MASMAVCVTYPQRAIWLATVALFVFLITFRSGALAAVALFVLATAATEAGVVAAQLGGGS